MSKFLNDASQLSNASLSLFAIAHADNFDTALQVACLELSGRLWNKSLEKLDAAILAGEFRQSLH